MKSSKSRIDPKVNDMFHSNPINFANKNFETPNEVFVKDINISLPTVIESYTKSIGNWNQLFLKRKLKAIFLLNLFLRTFIISAWKRFYGAGNARIRKYISLFQKYKVNF